MCAEDVTTSDPSIVRGAAAGRGTYTGTARVIAVTEELARVRPGDVLVTASTSGAFDAVLPLLGALVTDHGGLLSHAATAGRDYAFPCVVGTGDATARIGDGTLVRVHGEIGEVEILG